VFSGVSSDTLQGDDPDLTHVVASELRLLDPAVRRSPTDAGPLLDPDFREFGAFGRVWNRTSILDAMAVEDAPPPAAEQMIATWVTDDAILVTYRSRRPERTTLRSSLWRRRPGGPWQLYFHQGTVQR
jgi:ribonuclease HI